VKEGYTNVSRYWLGIPVWRALGGVTEIELSAVPYVYNNDKTAVFLDVRPADRYAKKHIAGIKNLPNTGITPGRKDVGEIRKAKNDGRLPYEDHNTRIIVFGEVSTNAARVAEALAKEGFHNVAFFGGSVRDMADAIGKSL